jgi:hypothetical protein
VGLRTALQSGPWSALIPIQIIGTGGALLQPSRRYKRLRLSIMYQKQKGLAMDSKNLAKIYIVETKIVSSFLVAR